MLLTKHSNHFDHFVSTRSASGTLELAVPSPSGRQEKVLQRRGTEILKVDQLEEKNNGDTVKNRSEFISYPIQLALTKEVEKVSDHCEYRLFSRTRMPM